MQVFKWLALTVLPAIAAMLLGSGCRSYITNLTPSQLPRDASGLYHFESEWETTQRSVNLRRNDIKAYVVVEQKFHPMERVPKMPNRWEADVPLPTDKNPVRYRFRWDYGTAGMGKVNPNSTRSKEYRIEVVEPSK